MKIALCFLISGDHVVNKEEIWRKWIEPNEDIINIYFHYKDFFKIKSKWIKYHCIPNPHIVETSYYHVVPAYLSLMYFAMKEDVENEWFCMLTESCVPLISPFEFREKFFYNYNKTILSWKKAWWNVKMHKRANLRFLEPDYHLGHSPYFVLCKKSLQLSLKYQNVNKKIFDFICEGGLANESIFAVMLKAQNVLDEVVNATTHLTDWVRMSSPTSPHLFEKGNQRDITFLENELKKNDNNQVMFLRKVASEFPDEILHNYIYERDIGNLNKRRYLLYFCELYFFIKIEMWYFPYIAVFLSAVTVFFPYLFIDATHAIMYKIFGSIATIYI